jgi:hypothetical protein
VDISALRNAAPLLSAAAERSEIHPVLRK